MPPLAMASLTLCPSPKTALYTSDYIYAVKSGFLNERRDLRKFTEERNFELTDDHMFLRCLEWTVQVKRSLCCLLTKVRRAEERGIDGMQAQ